jgi:hypothetical protein
MALAFAVAQATETAPVIPPLRLTLRETLPALSFTLYVLLEN